MSDDTRQLVPYRLGDGSHWRFHHDAAGRHLAARPLPVSVGELSRVGDHLARRGASGPPRVAVVTDEARLGAEALTVLRGVPARSPDLRQQTEMRIRHCALPAASVRDYVDLTRQCSAASLAAAVDALADDPGCDAVVVALGTASPDRVRTIAGAVGLVCRTHPDTPVVLVSPTGVEPPTSSALSTSDA